MHSWMWPLRSTKAPCKARRWSFDGPVGVLGQRRKRKRQIDPLTPPPPASSFPARAYEPRPFFRFEIEYESKRSRARVGRIHTPHGIVDTPGFVPVATNGSLKAVDHRAADAASCQLMFCNTYHLMIQPGPEIIQKAGGIHSFINRDRPIITDSGGFQVFSLSGSAGEEESNIKALAKRHHDKSMLKVTEEGAQFQSYKDGRHILLTPESSVQAQKAIGADIIIPLDELIPNDVTAERLKHSVYLTHRWEARSLIEHLNNIREQAMYSVIHGGTDLDLRKLSTQYLTSLPFDGHAIGGSLGRDRDEMIEVVCCVTALLPRDKPRHLLGIADLESIDRAAPLGVDTFDSCYPTRMARHGNVLTRNEGKIQILRGKYTSDYGPIDDECQCFACQNYSRAYMNHLLKAKEPVGHMLLTIHNLQFMNDTLGKLRSDILEGTI
mmetsp:Transcript_1616/g.3096  ORF Transcript_1616/g.3096 Transcript_1616/m.3096 type:complete len:438 (-) Transcript_1616:304-1617(-)